MIAAEWLREPLPVGWVTARICDHVDLMNGYPFDSELFSADLGMPLVRIRDIMDDNRRFITPASQCVRH